MFSQLGRKKRPSRKVRVGMKAKISKLTKSRLGKKKKGRGWAREGNKGETRNVSLSSQRPQNRKVGTQGPSAWVQRKTHEKVLQTHPSRERKNQGSNQPKWKRTTSPKRTAAGTSPRRRFQSKASKFPTGPFKT